MDSGCFVDIGADTEGFVPLSEMNMDYVERIDEAVTVGDEVRVVVTLVDLREGELELSIKEALEDDLDAEEAAAAAAAESASPAHGDS